MYIYYLLGEGIYMSQFVINFSYTYVRLQFFFFLLLFAFFFFFTFICIYFLRHLFPGHVFVSSVSSGISFSSVQPPLLV